MTEEQTRIILETIPQIVDFINWIYNGEDIKRKICIQTIEDFMEKQLHLEHQKGYKEGQEHLVPMDAYGNKKYSEEQLKEERLKVLREVTNLPMLDSDLPYSEELKRFVKELRAILASLEGEK